jgi:hypothetical protein
MRRPSAAWLDRMKFPLTLASGLRAAFGDIVSSPIPEALTALARKLTADSDEVPSEGNPSTTETAERR